LFARDVPAIETLMKKASQGFQPSIMSWPERVLADLRDDQAISPWHVPALPPVRARSAFDEDPGY